jgi:hypothetical protein
MSRFRTGPHGGGDVSFNVDGLPRSTYFWVTVRAWSGTAFSGVAEGGVFTVA